MWYLEYESPISLHKQHVVHLTWYSLELDDVSLDAFHAVLLRHEPFRP